MSRGKLLVALAWMVVGAVSAQAQQGPTVVILVRHAEKGTVPANDPPLTDTGVARAKALVAALADTHVDAVIATPTVRTRETAREVAELRGLVIESVALGTKEEHARAVSDAVRRHAGQTVLVVGHSNTIPAIIGALGGPKLADLCDDQYSNLFTLILTPGRVQLIRGQYGLASPVPILNCGNPMR